MSGEFQKSWQQKQPWSDSIGGQLFDLFSFAPITCRVNIIDLQILLVMGRHESYYFNNNNNIIKGRLSEYSVESIQIDNTVIMKLLHVIGWMFRGTEYLLFLFCF